MKRIKAKSKPPICPEHNEEMPLYISGWKKSYRCAHEGCEYACGTSRTSIPANNKTKMWRRKAHRVFDSIWRKKYMRRETAYQWLSKRLGIEREDCHFSSFGWAQCKAATGICRNYLKAVESLLAA